MEEGNGIPNISLHAREAMENDTCKAGERCGSVRMSNGTSVKHCLKALERWLLFLQSVASCVGISDEIDFTARLEPRKCLMARCYMVGAV